MKHNQWEGLVGQLVICTLIVKGQSSAKKNATCMDWFGATQPLSTRNSYQYEENTLHFKTENKLAHKYSSTNATCPADILQYKSSRQSVCLLRGCPQGQCTFTVVKEHNIRHRRMRITCSVHHDTSMAMVDTMTQARLW